MKGNLPFPARSGTFPSPAFEHPGERGGGHRTGPSWRQSSDMSVKIRLKRVGARNHPVFRIVVTDSRNPRDGRFIEEVGTYHPTSRIEGEDITRKVSMRMERIEHWLSLGARPSDKVRSFIKAHRKRAEAEASEVASA